MSGLKIIPFGQGKAEADVAETHLAFAGRQTGRNGISGFFCKQTGEARLFLCQAA